MLGTLELAHGTPYLLSLGLSKTLTALVWLAGPLSGLIMQPIAGYLSDHHRSPYGKRRPFLVFGTVLVVMSILLIAYADFVAQVFGAILLPFLGMNQKDLV
jgi:solute carrier family 45 protein 1/2/4